MKGFITAGLPSPDKIFWNSFQKLRRRATGKYNFPQVDESKFWINKNFNQDVDVTDVWRALALTMFHIRVNFLHQQHRANCIIEWPKEEDQSPVNHFKRYLELAFILLSLRLLWTSPCTVKTRDLYYSFVSYKTVLGHLNKYNNLNKF